MLWFSIFRCCFFVILPLTVIVVLVGVAVVTGVAVPFAQSGRKGVFWEKMSVSQRVICCA